MSSGTISSILDINLSNNLNGNSGHCERYSSVCSLWETRLRWAFLSFSVVCGAIATYTTRHFVNGDSLAYLDMADAFKNQQWSELINLHYSPGYAVLLGLADKFFGAGFLNELFLAKIVNFQCYLMSLLSLEVLLQRLKEDEEFAPSNKFQHVDWLLFRAVAYGLFLVCSLAYIRIRLISPDMLEFCFTLLTAAVLVWIKQSSDYVMKFVALGLVAGIGYLCKTPFFHMSLVFFFLSAFYAASVPKALSRMLVASIIFLIVSSSLWAPMSNRLGRLSIGESGNFNYVYFVSGSGNPVHVPEKVWSSPELNVYSGGSLVATCPSGFDLAYWNEGVKPLFDLRAQFAVIAENLVASVGLNPWLHLVFLVWLCLQAIMGGSFSVRLRPPGLSVLFGAIAAAGLGLFCLVLVESRYVAPYLFLGYAAVFLWPRYHPGRPRALKTARVGALLITAILIGITVASISDQTSRSLYDRDGKQSHRSLFFENEAIKEFLNSRDVSRGDLAGILGNPSVGLYWARLTGLRAIATIADKPAFLAASTQDRAGAANALRERRFKVIVGSGDDLGKLIGEGWCPVPGTTSTFVLFLQ